jgi:hypothetical protein
MNTSNCGATALRRGAQSLAELAETMREDLAAGQEQDALRLIFGFADDFRGSSDAGKALLIADEPAPTGGSGFDALLAGAAEFFAREAGLPAPAWVNGPRRFAVPWYFVAASTGLHAYVLAHTPVTFGRHGVFMAEEVFDRA